MSQTRILCARCGFSQVYCKCHLGVAIPQNMAAATPKPAPCPSCGLVGNPGCNTVGCPDESNPAPLCPVDGEALRPTCVHAPCEHNDGSRCQLTKTAPLAGEVDKVYTDVAYVLAEIEENHTNSETVELTTGEVAVLLSAPATVRILHAQLAAKARECGTLKQACAELRKQADTLLDARNTETARAESAEAKLSAERGKREAAEACLGLCRQCQYPGACATCPNDIALVAKEGNHD